MVTLKRFGEGTCIWCTKRTEGVEAEFKDGLVGFLCKRDLFSALKVRRVSEPASTSGSPPVSRSPS